jgi:hypothetical protein
MITNTLITPSEIKAYRPTADIDDARITPFIIESQQNDLRPVLNDALYYDLLANFNDSAHAKYAVYQNLINGKSYVYNGNTIYFDGIKPMLAYYALSRFIINNPVNITRFGVVQKINPQSEPLSQGAIQAVVNDLRSTAMNYQLQLIKFLEENSADYPLYSSGGASSNAATRSSFNFFRL